MTFHAEVHYLPSHGDRPEILSSPKDIDSLIDRLLGLPIENSIAVLYVVERPCLPNGLPDHELRIAVDRQLMAGALKFTDVTGNWVTHEPTDDPDGSRFYYLTGNETEFPSNSTILLSQISDAGKEFLTSGGLRPTCVQWQADCYV